MASHSSNTMDHQEKDDESPSVESASGIHHLRADEELPPTLPIAYNSVSSTLTTHESFPQARRHFRALVDAVTVTGDVDFRLTQEEQSQIDTILSGTAQSSRGIGAIELYVFRNPRLVPVGFWLSLDILDDPDLSESDVELLMDPQTSYPNNDLVGLLWSMEHETTERTFDFGKTKSPFPSFTRKQQKDEVNVTAVPVRGSNSVQTAPGRVRRNYDGGRQTKPSPPRPPPKPSREHTRKRRGTQENGLRWIELRSVIQDPDQSHGSRTDALYKAGLEKATGIPFNITRFEGMVVYYTRTGADSTKITSNVHEMYLQRAAHVKGSVLAAIAAKRELVNEDSKDAPAGIDSPSTMETEATTTRPQATTRSNAKCLRVREGFIAWLKKMRGGGAQIPHGMSWCETGWTFVGSFIGLLTIYGMNEFFTIVSNEKYFIVAAPFAALTMLQYGLMGSPSAQPRTVVFGHTIAGAISLSMTYIPEHVVPLWLRLLLAPSLSISAMMKLAVPCPPAAAISLIYAEGQHNWRFFGLTILCTFVSFIPAIAINNLDKKRQYPTFYWYTFRHLVAFLREKGLLKQHNDGE